MAVKRKLKPLLLSVSEVSQLYGLSESLIYGWVEEGAECFRCGRAGRRGTRPAHINLLEIKAFSRKESWKIGDLRGHQVSFPLKNQGNSCALAVPQEIGDHFTGQSKFLTLTDCRYASNDRLRSLAQTPKIIQSQAVQVECGV